MLTCVKPQQLSPPHPSPWLQGGPQGLQGAVLQGGGQGARMWGEGQSRCRGTATHILLFGCLSPKSVTQQGLSSWKGNSETNLLQHISGVKPFESTRVLFSQRWLTCWEVGNEKHPTPRNPFPR